MLHASPSRLARVVLAFNVVVVLTAAMVGALASASTPDASVGGGALLLLVAMFGLPWSLGLLAVGDGWPDDVVVSVAYAGLYAGPAVLNGFMLWRFFEHRQARRRQRSY